MGLKQSLEARLVHISCYIQSTEGRLLILKQVRVSVSVKCGDLKLKLLSCPVQLPGPAEG